MKRAVLVFATASCNLTPTPWPDPSRAPRARAPWSHPTDLVCRQRDEPDAFEVDGFLFCGRDAGFNIVPIDDPIYERCDASSFDGQLMAVFDGTRARGYATRPLKSRELVHDDWDGEPLLVDF